MAELLENSIEDTTENTAEDTGISTFPADESTAISPVAVQALADALAKIETYTPTTWVDNESPDIDAVHLNKAEQAIMRVTTAMNSAVDVIKDLQSQITTTNNNLSKAAIKSDLFSSGSITNPNTCTVPFSLVNGWHSAITNVPDAAKGKYSILLNIWEYGPSSTGNLTSNHMQALIIEKGGGIFTRLYINSAWSDWA